MQNAKQLRSRVTSSKPRFIKSVFFLLKSTTVKQGFNAVRFQLLFLCLKFQSFNQNLTPDKAECGENSYKKCSSIALKTHENACCCFSPFVQYVLFQQISQHHAAADPWQMMARSLQKRHGLSDTTGQKTLAAGKGNVGSFQQRIAHQFCHQSFAKC